MAKLLASGNATTAGNAKSGWGVRRTFMLMLPVLMVFVTTVAVALITDAVYYDDLMTNAHREVGHDAEGAALDIAKVPVEYTKITRQEDANSPLLNPLREEVRTLSKAFEDRITIISADGLVLADSDFTPSELASAENHAHRPEIDGARMRGEGMSMRVSSTLGVEFIYAAVPVNVEGTMIFVRAAKSLARINAQRTIMRRLLLVGALISISIVAAMSYIFSKQLAKAIHISHREKMEFSVNERVAVLGAMQELGSMLAICHSVTEAGEVVESQIPNLIPGSSGALSLMNNSRNLMIVEHEWGGSWTEGEYIKPDDCWALRKNDVHFSHNGDLQCKHLAEFDSQTRTMCIPLLAQGEILGVIHIREDEQTPFTEESTEIAKSLGREIATAISNLKLRSTLREQALHDPLTGLHNRRHLEDEFAIVTTQATYESKRCCLLILDVDHFKSYNDQYGHDAGDFVLSQLAKLFKKSVGGSDIACRLGGEEFGILMFDADMERATAFANELRMNVEKLGLIYEGRPLGELTISIGISSFPDDGIKLAGLLKSADEFLYEAKNSGRNRVCSAKAA